MTKEQKQSFREWYMNQDNVHGRSIIELLNENKELQDRYDLVAEAYNLCNIDWEIEKAKNKELIEKLKITDREIEITMFNNLKAQLPEDTDKMIRLLTRVQSDGAKWMRDKALQQPKPNTLN